jgi:hypothetical protein
MDTLMSQKTENDFVITNGFSQEPWRFEQVPWQKDLTKLITAYLAARNQMTEEERTVIVAAIKEIIRTKLMTVDVNKD